MEKYIIAGLGNPGPQYALTRHNIGFLVLDHWLHQKELNYESKRYAEVCSFRLKNKQVIAIKPQTYMNLSGKALLYWMKEYKVPVDNCMVVTDELSLPFGKIRMKPKGSDGGHNGLKNIQEHLNTYKYPRLRFGIGNDFPKGGQVDYVLGNFPEDQIGMLPSIMKKCSDAIETFVLAGLQRAMTNFNG